MNYLGLLDQVKKTHPARKTMGHRSLLDRSWDRLTLQGNLNIEQTSKLLYI